MSQYTITCTEASFVSEIEELLELELFEEAAKLIDTIGELGIEVSVSCPVGVIDPPKIVAEPKKRSMKTECQLKSQAWGVKPKSTPKVVRIGSQIAFALADAGITSKKLPKAKVEVVDPPKTTTIEEYADQILKAIGK